MRGIALDLGGKPVAKASVAIHNLNGSDDRKVESNSDGIFAADSLNPGIYEIKASKEGLFSPPATTVEIARGQTVRPKVILATADKPTPAVDKPAAADKPTAADKPAAAAANAPTTTAIEQELAEMKERIAVLEAALMKAHSVPEPNSSPVPAAPATAPTPTAAAAPDPPVSPPFTNFPRKSAAKETPRTGDKPPKPPGSQLRNCRMLCRPQKRLRPLTISRPSRSPTLHLDERHHAH